MTILCRKTSPKCKLCFQYFFGAKCMKIMLVMTNYAKKYASTIHQSLVLSTPLPFSLNDRLPLPFLIKLATKQLRHFRGKPNLNCFRFHFNPERFEVFRLKQSILTNLKYQGRPTELCKLIRNFPFERRTLTGSDAFSP